MEKKIGDNEVTDATVEYVQFVWEATLFKIRDMEEQEKRKGLGWSKGWESY